MRTAESLEIPVSLREALAEARHIVVLTGAGVSAASGIPTFRDALTGMWAKFDPMQLATPEAFTADPARVTQWYDQRRLDVLKCRPNPAHVALATLERTLQDRGGRVTLLTQNVDRLHQRAGSQDVQELHGSLLLWRCTHCGEEREYAHPDPFDHYPPPSDAGGLLRPAVVWFGELLPERAMQQGHEAMRSCDLFLSIGTSSQVYPAAAFIDLAENRGIPICEINISNTPMTPLATWSLQAPCDQVLPLLVQ